MSEATVSRLVTRYRRDDPAAFQPQSRAPHTHPGATSQSLVDAVLAERDRLVTAGLDAGADTIAWHLRQAGTTPPSRATIARILTRHGRVTLEPKKRPKSSYTRFEADLPNECWQSDFTHYRLSDGTDTEIITWLDDHSRYALHLSGHTRITTPIVVATFRATIGEFGCPASTLTDNGMVYTVRQASPRVRGGRNGFEQELARLHVRQKNGRGNHPQTQGKVCEESMVALHRGRSDPGQGMTMVSCVRFVGWSWCSSVARAGRTDLT